MARLAAQTARRACGCTTTATGTCPSVEHDAEEAFCGAQEVMNNVQVECESKVRNPEMDQPMRCELESGHFGAHKVTPEWFVNGTLGKVTISWPYCEVMPQKKHSAAPG